MDENPLAPNEYQCAICHNVYEKGWSEEEAQAETQATWGQMAHTPMAVVCDDCYQQLPINKLEEAERDDFNAFLYQQYLTALNAFRLSEDELGSITRGSNLTHKPDWHRHA